VARARRSAQAPKSDHPIAELATAKWRSSGLSDDDAAKLGLAPLTREEVASALGVSEERPCGVLIPYFDLDGKPTRFFRIRYLEKPPGFAGVVEKPQRYVQPAKTLNEVYLPPLLDSTWKEIAKDASVTIVITEGEFKAAAGCASGLATVGLGGVDLFRATKRGLELLPQLDAIEWDNRHVVIAYDSDAATNLNVVRAQRQLAHALVARGALPAVASLPAAKDGSKQGLDDFLIAHGTEAFAKLLADAPFFPEADALWGMNEEVVYVKDPGLVVERSTGQRMDPGRFAAHHFSNRHFMEMKVKTDGKGNQRTVTEKRPLARRWMEWERRAEVQRMTYTPGLPRLYEGTYNVWPGWGAEPKKGDISPWSWLLDHVFKGKPAERKWFEQWCAYPLQHPGVKMFTYVLLWSVEQGTGKSFISYALKGIYGTNGIEVGNDALRKGFNSWQENRQFVIGDEITAGEARLDADKLKRLICQPEVHINQKFLPEYTIIDCINYLFNSNHPDAMFMEDRDRRGFIHRVPDERLSEEFRRTADLWLNSKSGVRDQKGPGPGHLFHHLLHLDLTGFDPSAPAPTTAAKEEMILHGKGSLGMWVVHLKEDPVACLRPLGEKPAKECDLFTAKQLLRCFDPEKTGRVGEMGMGKELSRSMFKQLFEGKVVRTQAGVVRLYAVRNVERWADADEKDAIVHYNQFFGPDAQKF
jgi:hypothetical protein